VRLGERLLHLDGRVVGVDRGGVGAGLLQQLDAKFQLLDAEG
jgi:hypothetical protein